MMMSLGNKKLPCSHIFHTHCLRCAGSSAYAGLMNSCVWLAINLNSSSEGAKLV